MTVGIAMICDNGRSVVFVADRMVTVGSGSIPTEVDTDFSKITVLNSDTLIAYSGLQADRIAILERFTGTASRASVSSIASMLQSACLAYRNVFVDEKLRRLGTSLQALGDAALKQRRLNDLANQFLHEQCLDGSFLVAGVDGAGAHIYGVNEARSSPFDETGFAAIGSGLPVVYPTLAARCAQRSASLEEGIYMAYEAKRIAESQRGVGRGTQIALVQQGKGITFLPDSVITELDKIYDRRNQLQDADRNAIACALRACPDSSASTNSDDG